MHYGQPAGGRALYCTGDSISIDISRQVLQIYLHVCRILYGHNGAMDDVRVLFGFRSSVGYIIKLRALTPPEVRTLVWN